MKEQFLHFIWQYQRFNHRNLQTTCEKDIEIISTGSLNLGSGPDFLNAKIKIDGVLWVGHVEIHVRSSDWIKHKHSSDKNYKNVILHVVYFDDTPIVEELFPTLVLAGLIPKTIYDRYLGLMESKDILPCQHLISEIESERIQMYMNRLAAERLEMKVSKISKLLESFDSDFNQVAFVWLARYFGLGSNSDAFQELASRIPINWLAKIQHEPEGITALLLGSAGFLDESDTNDHYIHELREQFSHYKHKWHLQTFATPWWNWKEGRPPSFPILKLAQLAKLLENTTSIFQLVLDKDEFVKKIESIQLHEFWNTHYHLNKESSYKEKHLSSNFAERLLINVTVPMLVCYGRYLDDYNLTEKAMEILENLPAEKNKITNKMQASGLPNGHALDSQALIHLKNEYCDKKRCLECQIGNQIMRVNARKLKEPDFLQRFVSYYI